MLPPSRSVAIFVDQLRRGLVGTDDRVSIVITPAIFDAIRDELEAMEILDATVPRPPTMFGRPYNFGSPRKGRMFDLVLD